MKVCPVCGTEYGDAASFCSRDRSPLRSTGPAPAAGLLGTLIGDRYQVDARLGEGGMGEVYLATHVLMGRRCALKVMSPSLSQDPDAVSRFNREATNASSISHPNVCAVYDFGLTPDGLVYLAMEYIEGRTLTAIAVERGPMPVGSAADLVGQCAAGLEAAHELGIVHRDLKPDNIMVVSRAGRDTVKLVDFGIAKAMAPEPTQRVTKTGFVVGTPEYMSPEQIAGDALDGRSDEYSLALVFYRLVTGRLPFEGGSIQETLVKRLTDPPRALLISRPEGKFPAGLQGVMDRALARYPADRYPTVAGFVEALTAVVPSAAATTRRLGAAGAALEAELPPTRPLAAAGGRRGTRAMMAAAGIVVAAAGTWGVLHYTSPAPLVAPPASTPTPPARDSIGAAASVPASVPVPPPAPAPVPAAVQPRQKEVRPIATAASPVSHDTVSSRDTTAESPQAGDSLGLPEPEHFDSPTRRPMALRRAQQIMNGRFQPPQKRARAATLLAGYQLKQGNRQEAVRLCTFANALFPTPACQTMIRQLHDSAP